MDEMYLRFMQTTFHKLDQLDSAAQRVDAKTGQLRKDVRRVEGVQKQQAATTDHLANSVDALRNFESSRLAWEHVGGGAHACRGLWYGEPPPGLALVHIGKGPPCWVRVGIGATLHLLEHEGHYINLETHRGKMTTLSTWIDRSAMNHPSQRPPPIITPGPRDASPDTDTPPTSPYLNTPPSTPRGPECRVNETRERCHVPPEAP